MQADKINWFRSAAGYIDAHKGKTFVISLCDGAISSEKLETIVSDCILLNTLGVRLVIVFNGDQRIENKLFSDWTGTKGKKITRFNQIDLLSEVIGSIRNELEATFMSHSFHLPGGKKEILLTSGNFVKAKPLGIIDGVDYESSGEVRKINALAINRQLDTNAILLIPPIGFAPGGELFYLNSDEVACKIACAISADKLIYLGEMAGLLNQENQIISEIDLSREKEQTTALDLYQFCKEACNNGVHRCHVISHKIDGAIIQELFTHHGSGTQLTGLSSEKVRRAIREDLNAILDLVKPSEREGNLISRTKESIENELSNFFVIERDGFIIACAALHIYGKMGELACMVTHPDYRNMEKGDKLLELLEEKAIAGGLESLFVLTTKSAHWFKERDFVPINFDELPAEKKERYDLGRSSIILKKKLAG